MPFLSPGWIWISCSTGGYKSRWRIFILMRLLPIKDSGRSCHRSGCFLIKLKKKEDQTICYDMSGYEWYMLYDVDPLKSQPPSPHSISEYLFFKQVAPLDLSKAFRACEVEKATNRPPPSSKLHNTQNPYNQRPWTKLVGSEIRRPNSEVLWAACCQTRLIGL